MKFNIIDKTITDQVYEKDSYLYWKKTKGNVALKDSLAGSLDKHSEYYLIRINNILYRSHRILYQLYHNVILTERDLIDHINGIKSDNRKENLRICTKSENGMNRKATKTNKLGIKDVHIHKTKYHDYYCLTIRKNCCEMFREFFRIDKFSIQDVIKIRDIKLLELHGEFMNKGDN